MQPRTFIAATASEVVDEIRRELGPDAVVLNIRKVPAEGLARWFQQPRIEVTAVAPTVSATAGAESEEVSALADLRQEFTALKEELTATRQAPNGPRAFSEEALSETVADTAGARRGSRIADFLVRGGLLPAHVDRVLSAAGLDNEDAGRSTVEQLAVVREVLAALWPPLPAIISKHHVFIGPSGSGKTTALSRWLAQAVLVENRHARVLRLDGQTANTAESLSLFAEALGVPVERVEPASGLEPSELVFIDLPGINPQDANALGNLKQRVTALGNVQLHLVLNAAYEQGLLISQGRAFRELRVNDVILTHVDEDCRWAKLWNFVLGTNYTVSYLSGGQNVPGDFQPPAPENLLTAQFSRK